MVRSQVNLATVQDAVAKVWGYSSLRELQGPAIELSLQGRDSLVVLPTGGGKSLCYQAPAICMEGLTLVVSPLISLMKDQVDSLRATGIAAAYINSTLTISERREVANQIRNRELKLVYVSPERLLADATISFFVNNGLSMIAVDEAHCISSWGHDFRPEYRGLGVLRERFPNIGIHAYTATASPKVQADIVKQLQLRDASVLVGDFDRPNLVYRFVQAKQRLRQICDVLDRHRGESGIVYCISRKDVDETARDLQGLGFRVAPYHAGMNDVERREAQNAFASDSVDVIVATVAFGMGIDKSNVRFVIHASLPRSIENYQQESGRAGRDGLEAECITIHSPGDYLKWKTIIDGSETNTQESGTTSLQAMQDLCYSTECRHRALKHHFGQQLEGDNCGACDVCLGEISIRQDSLTLAQKILSCVMRLEQRFGVEYTVSVLRGKKDQKIQRLGHDQLSTYGLLKEFDQDAIRKWTHQLLCKGFLNQDPQYHTLKITSPGRLLLRGEGTISFADEAPGENAARLQADHSWEGVDRGLFEKLREVRGEIAASEGLMPYQVISDGTLRDLSRKRPTRIDGLEGIRGIGLARREKFGAMLTQRISEYCTLQNIQSDVEDWEPKVALEATFVPTHAKSHIAYEHFSKRLPLELIAQELKRSMSTIGGYLDDFIQENRIEDVEPWVPAAVFERIEEAAKEVGSMDRLRPIYDFLQGSVPYEMIRIALSCLAVRKKSRASLVADTA